MIRVPKNCTIQLFIRCTFGRTQVRNTVVYYGRVHTCLHPTPPPLLFKTLYFRHKYQFDVHFKLYNIDNIFDIYPGFYVFNCLRCEVGCLI